MSKIYSETSCADVNFSDLYKEEAHYWWSKARQNLVIRFIRKFTLFPDSIMLLDVGCGGGGLLRALGEHDKLFGIEQSSQGTKQCATTTKAKIVRAKAEELPFKEGLFDIVTSLDVIEHIDDDRKALKNFHRMLNKQGIIILSVPAFKFLWSPRDIMLEHKRRYTVRGLKLLLENSGFKIIKCSYMNSFYFPGLLLYSLYKRLPNNKSKPKTDILLLPKWIAIIFSLILKIEEIILLHANLPIGTSILCIARKKKAVI